MNRSGEKKVEYSGHYPDMILGNHGMVLALLSVETSESITEMRVEFWKTLSSLGAKRIIMIPKNMKVRVNDLLWNKGLTDEDSIGTYEVSIRILIKILLLSL